MPKSWKNAEIEGVCSGLIAGKPAPTGFGALFVGAGLPAIRPVQAKQERGLSAPSCITGSKPSAAGSR
ncbi:hypothetical protein DVB73_20545 [Pseudomonas plecoglossicida]|uniref:Uncharacterized protein n=1 Tax=Pseudomonas plecoglossicida TaxID=70775 RepID=A0AAD0R511_PSEDL|nr:hypothetical protein DVB73_20545 [Pseudomonas plecoglossicida]